MSDISHIYRFDMDIKDKLINFIISKQKKNKNKSKKIQTYPTKFTINVILRLIIMKWLSLKFKYLFFIL